MASNPALSPAEISAAMQRAQEASRELLLRRQWQDEFNMDYVERVFGTIEPGTEFKRNWHIEYLCHVLTQAWHYVKQHGTKRILINVSPRSIKSICITVAGTSWMFGQDPGTKLLSLSYAEKLSVKHNVETRLVLESAWYQQTFPETRVVVGEDKAEKWVTTERGHRIATSVGGSATGEGGNVLLMDDPVDPKRAFSQTEREGTNRWIDQVFLNRANDPKHTLYLGVMQRTHLDDPTAHLASKGGWEVVSIPQRATERRVFDMGARGKHVQEAGELMHPERLGEKEAAQLELDMGEYAYSAQYQQRPIPAGGNMVDVDKIDIVEYGPGDAVHARLRYWDLAATPEGAKAMNPAYTAGVRMALGHDGYVYIEHVHRVRRDPGGVEELVLATAELDGLECAIEMEQEPGSGGKNTIYDYAKKLMAYDFRGDKKTGNKTEVMRPFASAVRNGLVRVVRGEWNVVYLDELRAFPNGRFKDQGDATSGAYRRLSQREDTGGVEITRDLAVLRPAAAASWGDM